MSRQTHESQPYTLEALEPRLLFSGDPIYVAPIGDSVTYGSTALYQAGYRGPLEDLLNAAGQGHQFTGTLDQLGDRVYTGVDHRGHFAIPGTETGEILSALQNNNGSGSPTFDLLRGQGTSPDYVLLHTGTNNFDPGLTSDDVNAANELSSLLAYLHGPEGIDAGTKILLAQITPRADYGSGWNSADKAMLLNVAQYNYQQMPSLYAAYPDTVVSVDMFRININELTTLTAQERALANTDGDVYVDWILNYNEADPLNVSGTTGINSALFNDAEHPSALGYKIMAEVWAKALLGQSQPAPQPATSPISVGDLGKGVFTSDTAKGQAYLLYSQQNVHERFNHPWLSNSEYTPQLAQNLIAVKLINGVWHIDGNTHDFQAFTPTDTDVLIASIDMTRQTITSLQGTDSTISGINAGYQEGDLTFVANQWDNQYNAGEYQVFGTYFTPHA